MRVREKQNGGETETERAWERERNSIEGTRGNALGGLACITQFDKMTN